MWEQSPDASSTRAAGEGGAQAAEQRPCPPLAGTRPRLCMQGRGRGIAGSSGQLHSQLADHQSMTLTEETHGAQTSAADVREAAIFTEGRARVEPLGGTGRLGAKGVWSWGLACLPTGEEHTPAGCLGLRAWLARSLRERTPFTCLPSSSAWGG